MVLYIGLFLMVAMFSLYDLARKEKDYTNIIMLFCAIVFILLGGLRWETGTDWIPYYNFFTNNDSFEQFFSGGFEAGFAFLNAIIKSITDSYTVLLLIMAIIIVTLKYKVILLYSSFPLITLLLNFANNNGDIFFVRQSLALTITIFSVKYIIEKNFKKFFFGVVLATLVHTSAVIFCFAYYIYHLKIRQQTIVIMLISVLVASFSGITNKLIELLLVSFSGDFSIYLKMFEYLEATKENQNFGRETLIGGHLFLGMVKKMFFLPMLILFRNFLSEKNEHYCGFLNLTVFGAIFYFLFADTANIIAGRGQAYYSEFEIFIIPSLLLVNSNRGAKIIIWSLIVLYACLKYYSVLYGYYDLFVPYFIVFENASRSWH